MECRGSQLGFRLGGPLEIRVVRWNSRAPLWPQRREGLGESCLGPEGGPRWVSRLHPSQGHSLPTCSDFQPLGVLLEAGLQVDLRSLVGQGGLRVPTLY